jgi:hypothetical protein
MCVQQKDSRLPASHTGLLNSATDSKALTTTATARPPTIKNSTDCVGLQVGDEDDLEARRLKYVILHALLLGLLFIILYYFSTPYSVCTLQCNLL